MTCAELKEVVDLYLDGELDAARRPGLEAHAVRCLACGRMVDERRALSGSLRAAFERSADAAEPRGGERERLVERMLLAARRRLLFPARLAAAAVIGVTVGLVAYALGLSRATSEELAVAESLRTREARGAQVRALRTEAEADLAFVRGTVEPARRQDTAALAVNVAAASLERRLEPAAAPPADRSAAQEKRLVVKGTVNGAAVEVVQMGDGRVTLVVPGRQVEASSMADLQRRHGDLCRTFEVQGKEGVVRVGESAASTDLKGRLHLLWRTGTWDEDVQWEAARTWMSVRIPDAAEMEARMRELRERCRAASLPTAAPEIQVDVAAALSTVKGRSRRELEETRARVEQELKRLERELEDLKDSGAARRACGPSPRACSRGASPDVDAPVGAPKTLEHPVKWPWIPRLRPGTIYACAWGRGERRRGMRRWIAVIVAGLSSCHAAGRLEPAYFALTEAGDHVDVTLACGRWRRLAREADAAYERLAELLEIRPSRVKIAVVAGPDDMDAVAPSDAQGSRGLYYAEPEPLIVTYDQDDLRVIRHEMAHHFLEALAGPLPRWTAEGLCEVLGGARREGGKVVVPLLVVDRLEMSVLPRLPRPLRAGRDHVDYTEAWAAVAVRLAREPGRWPDRIRALARRAEERPANLMPSQPDLLALARSRLSELVEALDSDEPWDRASAARMLGRLGEAGALRRAFRRPGERLWVLATVAGALGRAGDRSALAELRPQLLGDRELGQVAEASGRRLESTAALDAWLAEN
jgi:hypothetical protein